MPEPAYGFGGAAGGIRDESPASGPLLTMLRLHWFIRLRWVFLAAASAVLVFERYLLPGVAGSFNRPTGLIAVIAALGVVNLIWTGLSYWLFRATNAASVGGQVGLRRTAVFANAQVAVDLLLLTLILRYTGGVESPLAIFYLFHVAIVALLLPRWEAILQAAWAMAL